MLGTEEIIVNGKTYLVETDFNDEPALFTISSKGTVEDSEKDTMIPANVFFQDTRKKEIKLLLIREKK